MKKIVFRPDNSNTEMIENGQKGSALVIALFVLALIGVFVALALSRTATEAAAVGNEAAEGRTFYAAQGSLETMTRNFNKVFDIKLNPSNADIDAVRNGTVPGLTGTYTFGQEVDQISNSTTKVLNGGPFSGLYAIQDNWRLRTTATDDTGTQIRLTRNILNNRIPIFQFGIFYDDDLELYRPPRFSFGGRVHSNRHFFVSPGAEGVYFDSRVTAAGHVVTQSWRNWYTGDSANNQTWIKNASGVFRQLLPGEGSVLNGTPNIFTDPDLPQSRRNPNWTTQSAKFDGNLQSEVRPLRLPLNVGSKADLVEMVKRGKQVGDMLDSTTPVDATTADSMIVTAERFANKTGIRVSIADSKAKLPGCASGTGNVPVAGRCGVRLDGRRDGLGLDRDTAAAVLADRSRGYQPKAMKLTSAGSFTYVPTRLNGERFHTPGREIWIKVETVATNSATNAIETMDITEEFLSLGVTEQPPTGASGIDIVSYDETPADNRTDTAGRNLLQTSPQTPSAGTDSRSIIKLQRFAIPGPAPLSSGGNYLSTFSNYSTVIRYNSVDDLEIAGACLFGCTAQNNDPNSSMENYGHLKRAFVGTGGTDKAIVPFPIKMFDTREGLYYDERNTTYYPAANYGALTGTNFARISRNGIMSMVDIDIANLRRLLRGDFNGCFPTDTPFALANAGSSLTNADIPNRGGWVLYVSDRRGDEDFDGEFDMEDIYGSSATGGNDGILQKGEDLQQVGAPGNGVLNTLFGTEAERYRDNTVPPDLAAVTDHKYFRRGVRLINGVVVPGIYDSVVAANTMGFTVATENGVYVKGNYNATHVVNIPTTGNTTFDNYRPFNTPTHIPASIVADAVTILSNAWVDGRSFSSPYDEGNRLASDTQMRFAMIAGDTIATREVTPNQGGIGPRMNGGVHNFKRFLERWTGNRLNYSGSLINLFYSRNNNGSFKCCNTVYDPPIRDWVFDSTFLDPARLPPGTPYFQYVQTTGFQRSTD